MSEGQKLKLFDACNFKGTFASCKPGACVECHKDKDAGFLQHIKGQVFEVSDENGNVTYPTPQRVKKCWILRKLGVLFGTRCPCCFSKNITAKGVMKAGYKLCINCEKYFK